MIEEAYLMFHLISIKVFFTNLRDQRYFSRVSVAFGGLMWPHEQDFSAETIEYELQEEQSPDKPVRQAAKSRR